MKGLSKSLTENIILFVVNILGFTTESSNFSSNLIASLSCTLHQSTLDTEKYPVSSVESIFGTSSQ